MATKSKGSSSSNGSAPKAKAKGSSRPKAASKAKSSSRSKSTSRPKSSRSKSPSAARKPTPAKQGNGAVAKASDRAGKVAGNAKEVAAKAAGPALAVGAAAAGVAGGVLLRNRNHRRKSVLGVPMPRSLSRASMPDLDPRSMAKTVGKASKRFAETSKSISKDLERAGDQAERVGKILD